MARNAAAIIRSFLRACGHQTTSIISSEYHNRFVWIALLYSTGCLLYLLCPDEPPLPLHLALLLAGAGATWFAWRLIPGSLLWPCMGMAMSVMLGFSLTALHAYWRDTPQLTRPIPAVQLVGDVIQNDSMDHGCRLLIAVHHMHIPPMKRRSDALGLPLLERVRVNVRTKGCEVFRGDIVGLRASLMPVPSAVIPGGYNFQIPAYFQSIGAVGFAMSDVRHIQPASPLSLLWQIERLRHQLKTYLLGQLGPDIGHIAAALMVGSYAGIDETVLTNIRIAGLAHLLAVSGMHLSLISVLFFWLIRYAIALVPSLCERVDAKKIAAMAVVVGAYGYMLLTGSQVSIERAYIMVAVVMWAIIRGIPSSLLHGWALALLVILILQPYALLSPGFQMSFAAVLGLICCLPPLHRWLKQRHYPAWSIYSITLFASSLVASLMTMPFSIYHFYQTSWVGIFANMLAVPLANIVSMPLVFIAMLVYPIGLSDYLMPLIGYSIEWMMVIAREAAAFSPITAPAYMPPVSLLWLTGGATIALIARSSLRYLGIMGVLLGAFFYASYIPVSLLIQSEKNYVAMKEGSILMVNKPIRSSMMRAAFLAVTHTSAVHYRASMPDAAKAVGVYESVQPCVRYPQGQKNRRRIWENP